MAFQNVFFHFVLTIVLVIMKYAGEAEARPGLYPVQELLYTYPSASQQTTVIRDVLGNQGTAYAYQNHDGISASVVAVSRSDNSKTLAYLPVAPAFAHQPLIHDPYSHHHAHHGHYEAAISPSVAYSGYHSYV